MKGFKGCREMLRGLPKGDPGPLCCGTFNEKTRPVRRLIELSDIPVHACDDPERCASSRRGYCVPRWVGRVTSMRSHGATVAAITSALAYFYARPDELEVFIGLRALVKEDLEQAAAWLNDKFRDGTPKDGEP